ncbi:alpha/beta fold hydrolase [Geobacter argillaceus]|uniref:Pimeloyl-ACP methyl ester carboxylesterase n=1 Tax=Geobacter argillaceus TaxID=345631 RepID=A0A562VG71_9BACT|nr:alpha/beta hydrolase [Geobacter argillaceus]TWJ16868.1 pimeloyl-ACP methyl ester carboxylesterase [Geobacter argillaceus]
MKIAAPHPLHDGAEPSYEFRSDHRFSPGVQRVSRLFTSIIPCVTGVGCLYQAVAAARDRRVYPPPGHLLDIDGCRMHLLTAGSGNPTVVLETGLGGMSSAWGWIQPETAKFSRVVSYDRTGLGWSEADTAPRTAQLAVRRLRDILRRSRLLPPYVLVGHSMGGLFMRVFADRHPEEVAGMVLVDAAHPDQHLRSPAIDVHMRSGFRILRAVPLLARLGYVRLTGLFNAWAKGLPPRQAAEAEAFLSSYRHLRTTRDESLAWEALCTEVRATGGLGGTPLAVVTAGKDVLPGQPELQAELAALSGDSIHLTVRGADHVSLVTRREHAQSVVEAIRHVVGRVMSRGQKY